MSSFVSRSLPRLALSCIALAVLAACNRGGDVPPVIPTEPAELTWARNALERNPQFEVLASDSQTRMFTVRNRATGQVETINLNELAAAPIAQLRVAAAPLPAPAQFTAAPTTLPAPAQAPATNASEPAQAAQTAQPERDSIDSSPAAAAERAEASESNYTIDRS
ncbi:MAG: hypothetical protein ABW171_08725, partial [Steroidobacter sp.]